MKRELNLAMQPQEQTLWCWSAVAASVAAYFDGAQNWAQCDLVNQELGLNSCCIDGSTTACNRFCNLDRALARVGHLKGAQEGPATFATCNAEICDLGRPIGVRIQTGGLGHFIALSGVSEAPDQVLAVQDPWAGPSYIDYDSLRLKYLGFGQWTDTYFTR